MRVTLKTHSLLALALSIFVFLLVLFLVSRAIIFNGFSKIEAQQIALAVERYENTFKSRLKFIESKLSDWAIWDDSFEFLQNRNPRYIASNYGPRPFSVLNINIAAIFDRGGRIVFAREYGPTDKDERFLSPVIQGFFQEERNTVQAAIEGRGSTGLVAIGPDFYLLSIQPVLPTSAEGTPRGALLFARKIDDRFLESLNTELKVHSTLYALKTGTTSNEPSVHHDDKIEGQLSLKDIHEKPVLGASIFLSRPVYLQAKETILFIGLLFICISVFFVALVDYFLNAKILRRIQRMKEFFYKVDKSQDYKLRYQNTQQDELDDLAVSFNSLLDRVSQSQALLRTEEQRYRLAIKSASGGVWDLDLCTKEVIFDQKFKDILGFQENELQNQMWIFDKYCHPEDLPAFKSGLKELVQGSSESFALRLRMQTKSGEWKHVQAETGVTRDDEGMAVRIIGWLKDVSSIVETEKLVVDQQKKITQATKMTALGQMAGGIAHEINNPLAVILGSVQLLQMYKDSDTLTNERLTSQLSRIEATTNRISKIVRSLRNFARDGSHDPFELVEIRKVIDDSLSFCRERIKSLDIQWSETYQIESSAVVSVRPVEISQVLVNLLNNAIDHVKNLKDKRVELSVDVHADTHVIVGITNGGDPLPREIQNHLFEPFFSTKETGQGTGLGLSISHGLAQQNNARLYYDSLSPTPRFILEIPLARLDGSTNLSRKLA